MVERVLHISASPRGERSVSARFAETFLTALAERKAIEVDRLDPWECELPEVDGDLLAAKYAGLAGEALTPEQEAAWDQIRKLAERFHRANTLLFSVPLWNFGIPYKLKHLIDAISHKGILFTFDERGLGGMLGGRRAVAIYTRGLGYGSGSQTPDDAFGLEKPYLDAWFRFVGISTVYSIVAEQTLGPSGAEVVAHGSDEAALLARNIDQEPPRAVILGRGE
ncbi:NAD(P)H-dependent oxidoreductase [Sandaracinobacter sp. RS1-74]|uniref:FMN-dependent NADH-azoreductase n=1 Tax=Sandaracinobacteroides sayramensis TaxID=2913411 RepID=UPI001EDB535A|nr:NAD(P)H-dependent oxidoreductase [Sandaracinobacteroides sayramensis]MCG2842254.1 NAD(P)H-dependent oxidoreductase [Sandaracinobacteroides sayramensis]